ncbi:MAG TPA: NmrA family NAD(P)-binding protein, partial [Polyangiales bacterium]|nr:NmrA family NAD(P)-binding protein [Polyangiales bacterium]
MVDLVVGATGMLGSQIASQLLRSGRRVRALVRASSRPERVAQLKDAGAELVYGDLKEPHTLSAACGGVSSVISTASATNSRASGDSIETVDGTG